MTRIVIATQRSVEPEVKSKVKSTRTKSKCCTLITYSILPLLLLLTAVAVLLAVLLPSRHEDERQRFVIINGSNVQALLIAGSNGFNNYRHQADVALTYHLLLQKGVPRDNIIVMMFDDIAYNPQNPYRGELRSSPNGPNLYSGLRIDYKGYDVNIGVLNATLSGNWKEVASTGTTRVLKRSANRNIFLYYSDHGHEGILGMPSGEYLTKRKLEDIVSSLSFNDMAIYIEACNAAQMVQGFANSKNIYALAASNSFENSYAANCRAGICYSDEFTLAWTDDTSKHDIKRHTLGNQYDNVKSKVHGSTPTNFGNYQLKQDWLQNYQGGGTMLLNSKKSNETENLTITESQSKISTLEESLSDSEEVLSIPSTDVPLYSAQWRVKLAKTAVDKTKAQKSLDDILTGRVMAENLLTQLTDKCVALYETNHLTLPKKSESENDCYESVLETFSTKCFELGTNTYFTRMISKLKPFAKDEQCEAILDIIREQCENIIRKNGQFII